MIVELRAEDLRVYRKRDFGEGLILACEVGGGGKSNFRPSRNFPPSGHLHETCRIEPSKHGPHCFRSYCGGCLPLLDVDFMFNLFEMKLGMFDSLRSRDIEICPFDFAKPLVRR